MQAVCERKRACALRKVPWRARQGSLSGGWTRALVRGRAAAPHLSANSGSRCAVLEMTAGESVNRRGQSWRMSTIPTPTQAWRHMVRAQAVQVARRAASGRRAPSELLTRTDAAQARPVTIM